MRWRDGESFQNCRHQNSQERGFTFIAGNDTFRYVKATNWEFANRAMVFGLIFGCTFPLYIRSAELSGRAPEDSAESDELDVLATLIEAYEREHDLIDLSDPIEAIKFRLEQSGNDSRTLIGVIGQRTRVYEVMRGKRPLLPEYDS
jgi:hypothetical protein